MLDPWIGFLNEELADGPQPEAGLARATMRQRILDRAASNFPFPLEVSFRGLVIGRQIIDGQHYLVLAPTGLAGRALEVLGGILAPTDRPLFPGAVVDATCWLADPDTYTLDEGVMSQRCTLDTIVPVEP